MKIRPPQKTQLATRLRRMTAKAGLLPLSFVVWRTAREWSPRLIVRNSELRKNFASRTPIPPGELVFSATGSRSVEWFLDSGRQTSQALRKVLESVGRPIESFHDVFELGCGCGRVLRYWSGVEGPRFFASDYNPRGVEWAKRHFGFVSFKTNQLVPPLPFGDGSFDLCYAISVFTHLPEDLQLPWLEEMHRVLRPGGILIVTLSGEGDLVRTTPDEQARFQAGHLVVVDPGYAGTNICGVYHPQRYVRSQWFRLFSVRKFLPRGAAGAPLQDLYLLDRQ